MQEARDRSNLNSFVYDGQTLKLWASPLRTKEERLRNRRLVSLATTIRAALAQGEQDTQKEPYQMVCWKSAAIISSGRRVVTVPREYTNVEDLRWHAAWHDDVTYTATQTDITAEATSRVRDIDSA